MLPNISIAQVQSLIPQCSDVTKVGHGGQKVVFRGTIDGVTYAIKFATAPPSRLDESEDFAASDVAVRAKREVETMAECTSLHMVKIGPIGLQFASLEGQNVLYFAEQYIDGVDLQQVIKRLHRLTPPEVVKLGLQITDAIASLWELGKIHRDIKPANIMQTTATGDFTLLDAGFAFDVAGDSLSIGPVGTPAYFSPEQFDFMQRRTLLDFRSDIFSLGVTMYVAATGRHPFFEPGDNSTALYGKITSQAPTPPSDLINDFPLPLEEVILRMMGKSPHLRYRRCNQLIQALEKIIL